MKAQTRLLTLAIILSLASASLLGACGDNQAPAGILPAQTGPGPRVMFDLDARPLPEIPLPNDLATKLDPKSVTGRRVNVSMLAPTWVERRVRRKINLLGGFGIYSPITVRFSAPLDLDNLLKRHRDNTSTWIMITAWR